MDCLVDCQKKNNLTKKLNKKLVYVIYLLYICTINRNYDNYKQTNFNNRNFNKPSN